MIYSSATKNILSVYLSKNQPITPRLKGLMIFVLSLGATVNMDGVAVAAGIDRIVDMVQKGGPFDDCLKIIRSTVYFLDNLLLPGLKTLADSIYCLNFAATKRK